MRKLVSIMLSIALLISMTIVASATSETDLITSPYTTATVQESPLLTNTQNDMLSISDLNELSYSDLQHYDLIILDECLLSQLTKETASAFLESGGVLGVETPNSDSAISEIYAILDIEKPVTIETDGVIPLVSYVTMRNGMIVPGVISQGIISFSENMEKEIILEDPVDAESLSLYDRIDTDNFLDFIKTSQTSNRPAKNPDDSEISPMMAPSGFDFEFDNYISFKSNKIGGKVMGSVSITQYVYEICSYSSGGDTVEISDVVSHVVVDSGDLSYVKTYDVKMEVSGSNMSIIDQTYLDSNSSTSISLSGGFSADSDNVISGSIEGSTTYTYDTNNQTITNNFSSNTSNSWYSDPTENWRDASWVLDPGIRTKNSNSSSDDSSAYTSIEEVAFKWHYMSAQSGTESHTSPLRVGGKW